MRERWLWLRADVQNWWRRHGFTVIRWPELAKLRQENHAARLGRNIISTNGPDDA